MFRAMNQIKYISRDIRQTKCYIFYQIIQLILATLIIVRSLTSKQHFRGFTVIMLQYLLLLLMMADMLIRLAACGIKKIFKEKGNIIDFCVLIIFAITLICLTIVRKQQSEGNQSDQQYEKILQTDDIIIIAVVLARYVIQITRTICTIKQTHNNMKFRQKIQKLDLNIQPGNSSMYDNSIKQDQIMKDKIMKLGKQQKVIGIEQKTYADNE